jgi:DtxR family transcriptional regulator, Mn-dependent transcriptional regulator
MSESLALSASLEDYLEAIFHIAADKKVARSKDISSRLGVNNSSVTGALRALAERGLVNYAPYDLITLTDEGRAAAQDVIRRHEALRDFFIKVLSVDAPTAEEGACKMEHAIPPSILERFIEFVEFVELCPRAGADWVEHFGYSCRGSVNSERCNQCTKLPHEKLEEKSDRKNEKGTMTLSDLKTGHRARLLKVRGQGEIHKRLVDMGMTPGVIVTVERIAPLGDPIDFRLRGYHLSLRKEEAKLVTVETIEEGLQ